MKWDREYPVLGDSCEMRTEEEENKSHTIRFFKNNIMELGKVLSHIYSTFSFVVLSVTFFFFPTTFGVGYSNI